MKWYRRLYIGENARKDRYRIVGKVKWKRPQHDSYLITLPSNEQNLLDIYPANAMLWRYFRRSDIFVLGIAKGYDEATELACRIVEEVYRNTGAFDIRGYIEKSPDCQK